MKKRTRDDLNRTFTGLAGWLFADLLLALAILFLVANTLSQPKPPVGPKLTPTATPTTAPSLEQQWHAFTITINPQKLLSNDGGEKNSVIQQIRGQSFLNNRRAGLIIVYGGAPTESDITAAQDIASAIYNILPDLGKQDARFASVAKYVPLYWRGVQETEVNIHIFLFAQ